MKTTDKNPFQTKSVNCRIAEIREAIELIKIQLSEIEQSDESKPIRYMVGSEMTDFKIYLRRFKAQLEDLSELFV